MFHVQIHRPLKFALTVVILAVAFYFVSVLFFSAYSQFTDSAYSLQTHDKLAKIELSQGRENTELQSLPQDEGSQSARAITSSVSAQKNHLCMGELACLHCSTVANCSTPTINSNSTRFSLIQSTTLSQLFFSTAYISQTLSPIKHPPRLS